MSYVFNAAFLGRTQHPYGLAPTGQLSRVRAPGEVFLFADGLPAGALDGASYAVFDQYAPDETMAELWHRGGAVQIDFARHRLLLNAVFLDGHAASFRLPRPGLSVNDPGNSSDLPQIGISKGIYN